jgi:hypothetical protein
VKPRSHAQARKHNEHFFTMASPDDNVWASQASTSAPPPTAIDHDDDHHNTRAQELLSHRHRPSQESLRNSDIHRYRTRYQSYYYAPPEDPDSSSFHFTPYEHAWDQVSAFKRHASTQSRSLSIVTDNDADELSLLLGPTGQAKSGGWGWVKWMGRMWRRNLVLVLLPVLLARDTAYN